MTSRSSGLFFFLHFVLLFESQLRVIFRYSSVLGLIYSLLCFHFGPKAYLGHFGNTFQLFRVRDNIERSSEDTRYWVLDPRVRRPSRMRMIAVHVL